MTARTASLGAFAPSEGAPNRSATVAAAAGILAVTAAIVRAVVVESGGGDLRWVHRAAIAAGLLGIAAALVGMYQISARGQRGRALALAGLWTGIVGASGAYVYAAVADGTIRLDRFADAYLDVEILRVVWPDLARGAVNTVQLAFIAEVLAIGVGLIVAAMRLSRNPALRYPAIGYVDVIRGMPIIVLTSLIFFGLSYIGLTLEAFTAAVVALTVNASAYIAEIFRAGIQSLPRGQMDAARSLGMAHGTAMVNVILPQAVRAVIPPLMSEFIALIKDTAFVLLVTGVTVATRDIYGAAQNGAASTFSPTPFMGAAIAYLILTIPLTRLVGYAERRLRVGLA